MASAESPFSNPWEVDPEYDFGANRGANEQGAHQPGPEPAMEDILMDPDLRGADPATQAWIRQNFEWDPRTGWDRKQQPAQAEAAAAPRPEVHFATIDLHGTQGTRFRAEVTGSTPGIVRDSWAFLDRTAARVTRQEMEDPRYIPTYKVIEKDPASSHEETASDYYMDEEPAPTDPGWSQPPAQPAEQRQPDDWDETVGRVGRDAASRAAADPDGRAPEARTRKRWHELRMVRFVGKTAAGVAILGAAMVPAYNKTTTDFAEITGSKQPAADLARTWHVDGLISNIPVVGSVVEE